MVYKITKINTSFQNDQWTSTWGVLSKKQSYPELTAFKLAWHQSLISLWSEHVDFYEGKKVLECGCGNGIFGLELANKFPHLELNLSDISLSALEYNKLLLAECRRLRSKDNFYYIHPQYHVEDMFHLKHNDKSFDFVINGGTLEHYDDTEILLLVNEMLRVLASAGTLIIVVPNLLNFDINLYKAKLRIKKITNNKLFKSLVLYGASDERNMTRKKFFAIVKNNTDIRNIKYLKHRIALPRLIPRTDNIILDAIEKILVKLGFNWAHIFIITKK